MKRTLQVLDSPLPMQTGLLVKLLTGKYLIPVMVLHPDENETVVCPMENNLPNYDIIMSVLNTRLRVPLLLVSNLLS